MSLTLLAVSFLALLALSYRVYGGWVAKQFGIDNSRTNSGPPQERRYRFSDQPTRSIYSASTFPQLRLRVRSPDRFWPVSNLVGCRVCWIGLGVVLIGAVHDFSSLTASVRHQAKSIAEITREHLGDRAGSAMLIFIWIAIVYVIIAFTDITSGSFVSATEELQGVQLNFNPGGAVQRLRLSTLRYR